MPKPKHVHLISFDIPCPANYGGVIDVFYKVQALYNEGVKVHLHCYEYGREHSEKLESMCHETHYYPRKVGRNNLFKRRPYIVVSRNSSELIDRLKADDHPIIFEGVHCCYYLAHPDLKDRTRILRSHNVEHEYYWNLAESESNVFKRLYFQNEAAKLERFEEELEHATAVAAISSPDANYFRIRFPEMEVAHVSAFHAQLDVRSLEGRGSYVLYHGNLGVSENHRAAMFLINEVFLDIKVPFVIAGSDAQPDLVQAVADHDHIRLENNVPTERIEDLIQGAHINVLPTFQATGIKLKLLSALYLGRHCLVNPPMVEGTGLEGLCHIAKDGEGFKSQVQELMMEPFALDPVRKEVLEAQFSNRATLRSLWPLLFEDPLPVHSHTLEFAREICE